MARNRQLITGGHTALGATAPSLVWYFAEGYTGSGFDQYFAILNPSTVNAEVQITYYLDHCSPIVQHLTAPANARTTVAVHDQTHGVGREQAVAAKVESVNNVAIVVERSMYFTYRLTPIQHGPIADPELIPPEHLIFVGQGDFRLVGQWFVQFFIEEGGLQPQHHVLDVGCGVGRIAAPLTRYLVADGSYTGFDIVASGIEWCQQNITPRFPNFHFQVADIHNSDYNPHGTMTAEQFRFPYDTASFDFVLLTSVFTHLLPAAILHYLEEIGRVLRPGGRCVATYFLLNEVSRLLINAGNSEFHFADRQEAYWSINRERPEAAVAVPEAAVRDWHRQAGLSIDEPIRYGFWSGRETGRSFQDIVLAIKS